MKTEIIDSYYTLVAIDPSGNLKYCNDAYYYDEPHVKFIDLKAVKNYLKEFDISIPNAKIAKIEEIRKININSSGNFGCKPNKIYK